MINFSALKSHISLIKNKYSSQQEYRIIKEGFDKTIFIVKEEKLFQAGTGYCFGEGSLIYNRPRLAYVVTLIGNSYSSCFLKDNNQIYRRKSNSNFNKTILN